MQVSVYKLSNTNFIKGLGSLLDTILKKGHRVHILCSDKEEMGTLDHSLWTYASLSFLPHGSEDDTMREKQKIYLSVSEVNYNKANILFSKHIIPETIEKYDRYISMYDASESDLLDIQIKRLKDKQITYTLFEETKEGWNSSSV
jgi:DNA polymerase-3 subunit chi